MNSVKDLRFIRFYTDLITDPTGLQAWFLFNSIPKRLWKVKYDTFKNLDNLYQKGSMLIQNPSIYLCVIVDPDAAIQGILWFSVNNIEEIIGVHLFAIDPTYEKKFPARGAQMFDLVWDYLRSLKLKINTVQFTTFKPNAYEQLGARRSKKVLMEIDLNVERPNTETAKPTVHT